MRKMALLTTAPKSSLLVGYATVLSLLFRRLFFWLPEVFISMLLVSVCPMILTVMMGPRWRNDLRHSMSLSINQNPEVDQEAKRESCTDCGTLAQRYFLQLILFQRWAIVHAVMQRM